MMAAMKTEGTGGAGEASRLSEQSVMPRTCAGCCTRSELAGALRGHSAVGARGTIRCARTGHEQGTRGRERVDSASGRAPQQKSGTAMQWLFLRQSLTYSIHDEPGACSHMPKRRVNEPSAS